jgi:malate synthase
LWQWVHHGAKLQDGTPVTVQLIEQTMDQELAAMKPKVDAERFSAYERAAVLMRKLIVSPTFPEFLTVPAYAEVLKEEGLVA